MLWMLSFCFYCSVRLGVITSAILSIIQTFVPLIILLVVGEPIFHHVADVLEADEEYSQQPFIRKILNSSKKDPHLFTMSIELYLGVHILACILAIIGAYRILKWLLVPYIIMEFIRVLIALTTHVIAMIVLKKVMNLGLLIAATVTGGFLILWIGYMWAGAVALFQIITFINMEKYKQLYGSDPLAPFEVGDDIESSQNQLSVENIKIFSTPNYEDVDALKNGTKSIILKKPKIVAELNNSNNDYWHAKELIGMNFAMKKPNYGNKSNIVSYY